jgi:O-antigen ligase
MSRILASLWKKIRSVCLLSRQLYLLEISATILVIVILFSQHNSQALFVFVFTTLPLGGLGLLSPSVFNLRPSFVLILCVIYLLAMLLSSAADVGWDDHRIWVQLYLSLYVTAFLLAFGGLIADNESFINYFFLFTGISVGISAAVNIFLFYQLVVPENDGPLSLYRLVGSIGMPAYANSTNISTTYAVFFVASISTALQGNLSTLARQALYLASGILGLAVLLTQARGAYVAVLVGILVIVLTGPPRVKRVAVAAALVAALLVVAFPFAREIAFTRVFRGFGQRPEVWKGFLDLIWQRPWLGYGSFNPAGVVDAGTFLDQAHNLVLSAWFRGGIASAIAMASILVGGLYWGWQYWLKMRHITPLCVIATITTAGMFDHQLLITSPTWPWVTFWLPFGLCVGAEMTVRRLREQGMR